MAMFHVEHSKWRHPGRRSFFSRPGCASLSCPESSVRHAIAGQAGDAGYRRHPVAIRRRSVGSIRIPTVAETRRTGL